eukprot:1043695-Heterocapsa_arctica.AAC.1
MPGAGAAESNSAFAHAGSAKVLARRAANDQEQAADREILCKAFESGGLVFEQVPNVRRQLGEGRSSVA